MDERSCFATMYISNNLICHLTCWFIRMLQDLVEGDYFDGQQGYGDEALRM